MQHNSPFLFPRLVVLCLTISLLGPLVGCDALTDLESGESNQRPRFDLSSADTTTVEPGIEVVLQAPDTVALGEAFKVHAHIDNQTGHSVVVKSGSAALLNFGMYDGNEVAPVEGSLIYCAQVVTEHRLGTATTTSTYDLRAVRASEEASSIAPGSYTARLTLNWRIDGAVRQDTLEAPMVFQNE